MAFETDLLEYEDIFEGSEVIARKDKELEDAADAELGRIMEMGGVIEALEAGYLKQGLVESNAKRLQEIESGDRIVVGVNRFTEGESSQLIEGMTGAFLTVDDSVETEQINILQDFRKRRDAGRIAFTLDRLQESVKAGENIMEASLECAEAGVTTGEWSDSLRNSFGEYKAPTGVSGISAGKYTNEEARKVNARVRQLSEKLGRNLKILIGKPGLDGHSNGAEQVAVRARDVGMEVVYEGIRLTPEQIAESALQEGVHVVGLSILSGSHMKLVPEVVRCMKERGMEKIPVVLGGIIPENDVEKMDLEVIRKVYAPKDYNFNKIMSEVTDIVAHANNIELT